MIDMGKVYCELRSTFKDKIELDVVDPRNLLSFIFILLQQGRRNRLGWRVMLRSMIKGFHTMAVFVNGELVSSGKIPDVNLISEKISNSIERQREGSINGT